MKKSDMKRNLVMMIVLMIAMMLFTGCSETALIDESTAAEVNVQSEEKVMDPWEFFGENNFIGKSMAEIEDEVGDLEIIAPEDGGTWNGGQWFRTSKEVVVAFDYSEVYSGNYSYGDEITDKSIICTGASGTPDTIFGMNKAATVDDVATALELELQDHQMEEGTYMATFTCDGADYFIILRPCSETTNGYNCSIDIVNQ